MDQSRGASAQQPKVFRRGEVIYQAGDAVTHVYLVQSGLATVLVSRGEHKIEITQVGMQQILGEEALWGAPTWNTTAVANNDVRALPIEVEQAKAILGGGSQLAKVYTRGVMEKLRTWSETLLAIKLESDPTPCAPDRIVKLFATLHTVASYTGTKKGDATVVVWPSFKKYSQRIFLESPVRLEQAVNILVKLGYARLEFIPCETDPEAPDELGFVHFTDLGRVKSFYEYYRRRHFGSGDEGAYDDANEAILREIEAWNETGKVVVPTGEAADADAA